MTTLDLIEPQYLALCVFAGFVGLSVLIYAIASFGMREKSYEEALAEQRARLDKETQQQHEVKQQRRRQFAGRRKKEKEKPAKSPKKKTPQPEVIEEDRTVSEEEVVPPTPPENVTPRPEKKKKEKPAPVPKEKPVPVLKEKPAPVPKKVSEKPQVVEPEIIKPSKMKKTEAAPPPRPLVEEALVMKVVEEPVMAQQQDKVQAAPPTKHGEQTTPAKNKKAKQGGPSGDATEGEPLKGKALVSAVRNGQLKPNEIQQMMEILVGKQGGDGSADDWVMANQRTDPTSALKKQLQEKEQALHKEMLLSQSNMQKLKEVKAELIEERSHTKEVENRYKTESERQLQEIEALRHRMQQTHDQHSMETQALQTRLKEVQALVDASNIEVVKQLRDENTRLKTNHAQQQKEQIMGQELARLQGEIQKMSSQVAASDDQLRQANDMRLGYESRISSYEKQITQLESNTRESSSSLTKRLSDMGEEMRKLEAQKRSNASDLKKSQEMNHVYAEDLKQTQSKLQDLYKSEEEKNAILAKFEEKEKDAEYQRQGLETKVRAVESQLQESEKSKLEFIQEIKNLKVEKVNLESQVAAGEQRSEAEGQEEPAKTNGDVSEKDTISLTEHEDLLMEKQDNIDKLEQQVNASIAEVQTLNEQIEQQRKKNNALREKNWKAMEAISATEKSSEEKLKKSIKDLQDELNQKLQEEQQQSKDTVQRLFPSIQANHSLGHEEWLKDFEQRAAQFIQEKEGNKEESEELNYKISSLEGDCKKYSSNLESLEMENAELSKNLDELQYEKKQLTAQCDHYQSVLGDTEGMLNKLQSSVELEESKWEEKLASTEKLLQQDTSDYQKVVSDLEVSKSTIEQLQKDRHSVAEELDDVKKQLNRLKDELEAANQRAESNNTGPEMEQLKQKIADVNNNNEKLTVDLQTASTTINELNGQLENKGDVETLQKELTSTKEMLEQSKNKSSMEIQALQKQVEETKQALQETEKTAEKIKAIENERDAEKTELAKAKEDNQRLTESQNGTSENLEIKTKEIAALNTSLTEERKLKKDLGIAAGRLQIMLKKTQTLLESERKTSNQLRSELGKEPEAEVSSSLTDSQLEEELAEALKESIKLANQAAEESIGGTSV